MHILSSAVRSACHNANQATTSFSAVNLIISRCAELRELADLYDTLVDRLRAEADGDIAF